MTTLNRSRPAAPATARRDRAGHLFLVAGGAAFFIGGPLHPQGRAGDDFLVLTIPQENTGSITLQNSHGFSCDQF